VDLESAAEELYGAPAEEFARHRARLAAQAKAAGDRPLAAIIGKLRKPVLAAALINELVRSQPPELVELTELAQQMRTAHRELRGPELRALSEQRQQLLQRLTELVRHLAEEAGRGVTEPIVMQVRSTLEAAIADEGAEAAALSGRLTTVLSYSGFGEVDVTDAVAVPVRKRHLRSVPNPGTKQAAEEAAEQATEEAANVPDEPNGAPPAKTASRAAPHKAASTKPPAEDLDQRAQQARDSAAEQARQRRLERRQLELERAEAQHAKAIQALEQAEQDVVAAEQHEEEASARVEQLIAELSQAQEVARQAGQASRAAERERRTAEQEAGRAAATVRQAREQLD
jgi:hypothetical protein